jgi:hypothetical protein
MMEEIDTKEILLKINNVEKENRKLIQELYQLLDSSEDYVMKISLSTILNNVAKKHKEYFSEIRNFLFTIMNYGKPGEME